MTHREHHPTRVDGCFGCKVAGVGFDSGRRTRSTTDENNATVTEPRNGRQDVTVRPRTHQLHLTAEG